MGRPRGEGTWCPSWSTSSWSFFCCDITCFSLRLDATHRHNVIIVSDLKWDHQENLVNHGKTSSYSATCSKIGLIWCDYIDPSRRFLRLCPFDPHLFLVGLEHLLSFSHWDRRTEPPDCRTLIASKRNINLQQQLRETASNGWNIMKACSATEKYHKCNIGQLSYPSSTFSSTAWGVRCQQLLAGGKG